MTPRSLRLVGAAAIIAALLPLSSATAGPGGPGSRFAPFGFNGRVDVPFHEPGSTARAVVAPTEGSAYAVGSEGGDLLITRFDPGTAVGISREAWKWEHIVGFPDVVEGRAVAITADGSVVAGGDGGGAFDFARYSALGVIDESFGDRGQVSTPLGTTARLAGIAVRPAGGFLAAGSVDGQVTVVAYRSDGQVDASFGRSGVSRLPGGPLEMRALASDADGGVTLAGTAGGDLVVTRVGPTGQADTAFGDAGSVRRDAGGDDALNGVALDSTGRVVAAGTTAGPSGPKAVVWRLSAAGKSDASFGNGGVVVTGLRDGAGAADGIALLPDNRILIAGQAVGDVAALRLTVDGSPDPTFTEGTPYWRTRYPMGGPSAAHAVALDGSGAAVFVGDESDASGIPADYMFGEYHPDGFEGRGFPVRDHPRMQTVQALAIAPDGRFFAGGGDSVGSDFALSRYRPDGAPDTSFGRTGRVNTDFGAGEGILKVFPLPDGGALVAGQSGVSLAAARYRPDGTLDPSFGTKGRTLLPLAGPFWSGRVAAAGLDSRGRLVLGWADGQASAEKLELYRLRPDGSLDPAFGGSGHVVGAADPAVVGMGDMAMMPDDSILVLAGATATPFNRVIRYLPDGTPDRGFAGVGYLSVAGAATRLLPVPGGFMLGGTGGDQVAGSAFYLARYHSDGSVDQSFGPGGAGWTSTNFKYTSYESYDELDSLAVDPDGTILAGGESYTTWIVARYRADGSLDTTFGDRGVVREEDIHEHVNAILPLADGSFIAGGQYGTLIRYTGGQGLAGDPGPGGVGAGGGGGGAARVGDPAARAGVQTIVPTASGRGYYLAGPDGSVLGFGDATFYGSTGTVRLNKPIVGMAVTPSGRGYWLVATDGGIFSFGDAAFFGSTGNVRLNKPIVGMAATPSGRGYWLVASDGGIFSFGDAAFFGSTGNVRLNKPIVGMAATPSGRGYWLVATDGGIFSFGDAAFFGSTGNVRLNKPIVGMAATPSGRGYWLVATDGGIFSFGDAAFFGSTGNVRLNKPIAGLATTSAGHGYWLVASDGGIFAFGDAPFLGSGAG